MTPDVSSIVCIIFSWVTTTNCEFQVKSRATQLRGDAKTRIRPLVTTAFGLRSAKDSQIHKNYNHVLNLKSELGFTYEVYFCYYYNASLLISVSGKVLGVSHTDLDSRSGLYCHPIIQSSINALYFSTGNRKGEAISHPDLFNPVAVPAIALILTAVSLCWYHTPLSNTTTPLRLNAVSTSGLPESMWTSTLLLPSTRRYIMNTSSASRNLVQKHMKRGCFSICNNNYWNSDGKFTEPHNIFRDSQYYLD